MKVRSVALGILLAISASSCRGDGGDPYVNLRDSPLLSKLPPDAIALDVECRKEDQIVGSTDYFACRISYATDLEIPEIRAFHLPRIEELGYEVLVVGPQYAPSSRYLIAAMKGEDFGVEVNVRDPYTSPTEFAQRRWTVVVEVQERD